MVSCYTGNMCTWDHQSYLIRSSVWWLWHFSVSCHWI